MTKKLLYVFAMIFLFSACESKKCSTAAISDEENNETEVKLISKITNSSTDVFTEFSYDEKNRITHIKTWDSYDFEISYPEDNKLVYTTKDWEDRPVEVTYTLNENNTVTSLTIKTGDDIRKISYKYDDNNRLVKITPLNRDTKGNDKQTLKWDGNTLNVLTCYSMAGWGEPEKTSVKCNDANVENFNINFIVSNTLIDFGYDSLAKYLFALGYMGNTSDKLFNESKIEYQDYRYYKENCTYKYDEDGYPIEVVLDKKLQYFDEEEPYTEVNKYLIEYK